MKNPNHLQIPFRPQFKEVLLSGAKTMTSRTKRYGHVGSRFWAFSQCFEITEIRKLLVRDVAKNHFKEEGFESPQGFLDIWAELHPSKGRDIDAPVFSHIFKKVVPHEAEAKT